ncbi:MAG TPA: hypothetical protein VHE54_18585 [Puia sp.]|nr:hypothetical protein [Puia sp.]
MRKLLVLLFFSGSLFAGCENRNRVGAGNSTGDGGIAKPDSTTRYDTIHPTEHSDTSGRLHDTPATPDTERAKNKPRY